MRALGFRPTRFSGTRHCGPSSDFGFESLALDTREIEGAGVRVHLIINENSPKYTLEPAPELTAAGPILSIVSPRRPAFATRDRPVRMGAGARIEESAATGK